ncbi:hypothetical protein NEUTE2DRAFT_63815 [Neurospora tetrasperma FGSC 2509]|nr:hypothetical protein NEUTE2DRAFT_63815 [Neurospora tetrasperma FGSC 2509]
MEDGWSVKGGRRAGGRACRAVVTRGLGVESQGSGQVPFQEPQEPMEVGQGRAASDVYMYTFSLPTYLLRQASRTLRRSTRSASYGDKPHSLPVPSKRWAEDERYVTIVSEDPPRSTSHPHPGRICWMYGTSLCAAESHISQEDHRQLLILQLMGVFDCGSESTIQLSPFFLFEKEDGRCGCDDGNMHDGHVTTAMGDKAGTSSWSAFGHHNVLSACVTDYKHSYLGTCTFHSR